MDLLKIADLEKVTRIWIVGNRIIGQLSGIVDGEMRTENPDGFNWEILIK